MMLKFNVYLKEKKKEISHSISYIA